MNVAVIIVETPVESDRVCAKAAECFGNDACVFTIRVLAEFGTRTELSTWGYENSCCHGRLLVVSRVRRDVPYSVIPNDLRILRLSGAKRCGMG